MPTSPAVLLRPTAAADIPKIAAIYADAVLTGTASYEIEPPDEAEMARRWTAVSDRGFPHIVAVEAGQVLGYSYAGPYHTRRAYRYTVEDTVYVDRSAWRRGIGRLLLEELIGLAAAKGFRQMIAVIGGGANQPASVGLHRGLAFREIGTIEGSGYKHGTWLDTVLMQRPLGPGRDRPPDDI